MIFLVIYKYIYIIKKFLNKNIVVIKCPVFEDFGETPLTFTFDKIVTVALIVIYERSLACNF